MARPRKFDEERAVEAAMRAFWAAGYEATSTEDLCRATGLGRSSIYNTFRSKHDLFEKALRHYISVKNAQLFERLENGRPIRERIREMFDGVIAEETEDGLGCLVVNTMVELAPRDPGIAEELRRDYDRRLAALRDAFAAAQGAGEIGRDRDPTALAHFVIATVSGMRTVARAGGDRDALEGIADSAMNAL
ncbi:TetR/AcrR family transcriptional regulator [Actinomadura kijaniata]|uniref:TetR/AcrR family transcriptional regulator n=1 Tax=Actinomadura kijaniata TaxID=46161 RepID=UPI003F1DEAD2